MSNPTERFSSRVDTYSKYRPSYPEDFFRLLSSLKIAKDSTIAEIGAGTGILTKLLCDRGYRVLGIEPNNEMYEMMRRNLMGTENFTPIRSTAENTTLQPHSVNVITCAQSFHWFDQKKVKVEFKRVIKPSGWVFLLWNTRVTTHGLGAEYEGLLNKYAVDYQQVRHSNVSKDDFDEFWDGSWEFISFDNSQILDLDGLIGRMKSSSYTPEPGDEGYQQLIDGTRLIFNRWQENGKVEFPYKTEVYYGRF